MKKLFLSLTCLCLTQSSLANSIQPLLTVNIDFNYESHQAKQPKQYVVNDQVKLSTADNAWVIIPNQLSAQNDIVLLSKVEKVKTNEVTMKFLIIEADKNPRVISEPVLLMPYEQKTQVIIKNKTGKLQLTALAHVD